MGSTKVRLTVALESQTLEEAMRLTRSRTKRETIARALKELVKSERRRALSEAIGTGVFETTETQLLRRRRLNHARH